MAKTPLLTSACLLFSICLTRMELGVHLLFTVAIDSPLLWTNLKLLRSPTKDSARPAFKFSSPHLAAIFSVAMVAAILYGSLVRSPTGSLF